MKDVSAANTESVVFIIENQTTQRMLKMYLAAVGLDARVYSSFEDYMTRHDSTCTQSLVLDMQLPGMDGAILHRRKIVDENWVEKNSETFQLIPIKNKISCESLLFSRFASRGKILEGTEDTCRGLEGWE